MRLFPTHHARRRFWRGLRNWLAWAAGWFLFPFFLIKRI